MTSGWAAMHIGRSNCLGCCPEKYGKISDTLEVKPVESLVSHTEDVLVLISIYDDTTEIEKTLKEMHFSPESYKNVIYDGLTPIGIG